MTELLLSPISPSSYMILMPDKANIIYSVLRQDGRMTRRRLDAGVIILVNNEHVN